MDERGVNKKTYKNIKKEIVEDTALNVGYYTKVINKIPYEVLLDTIKEISLNGWINENTDTQDLQNMIVTESVKNMSYQEFKDIADNFFSFVPDDKEKYYRVSTLEITREDYDYLINNTKKVFGLERKLEEIENKENSLETKINNLETAIVPSDDEVVGIDLEKEEILLLKSLENTYIVEEEIMLEEIINNYRSNKDDYTQILDYLVEKYDEIKILSYEYILNNDTYRGILDIDPTDIYEIEELDISQFKTHKEYYEYAREFNSFNEQYSSYEDYIYEKFNYIYSLEYAPNYSKEILEEKRDKIDEILEKNDALLLTKDIYGNSQKEKWTIGYLANKDEDIELIEDYIENYIGAFYKGTLTELQIIPFNAFEKGKYTGELDNVYYINREVLSSDNKLKDIQKEYKELKNFKTREEALKTIENKEKVEMKEEKERNI